MPQRARRQGEQLPETADTLKSQNRGRSHGPAKGEHLDEVQLGYDLLGPKERAPHPMLLLAISLVRLIAVWGYFFYHLSGG